MISNLCSFIIFLIPAISMLSGLVTAPGVTILFTILILTNYKKIDFTRIVNNKYEIAFFAWLLLSCIWSPAGLAAFSKFASVSLLTIGMLLVTDLSWYEKIDKYKKFALPLIIGSIFSLIFFLIEYISDGFISKTFRSFVQPHGKMNFHINFLDRGCSVLAMLAWPVILVLCKKRKWLITILYIVSVVFTLRISDSLASYLGFILGIIVFLCLLFSRMYLIYFVMFGVFASAIFMPIFSYIQSPRELCHIYPNAPDSGKHRLYIWKFASEKAIEKLAFGYGFNSSPEIEVDEEEDMIYYNQYRWHPLPLHPHNVFIQFWLETGIVGLALFTGLLLKIFSRLMKAYRKNSDLLWASVCGGCFANYFFIALISYGVWQLWWLATNILVIIFFVLFQDIENSPKSIRQI